MDQLTGTLGARYFPFALSRNPRSPWRKSLQALSSNLSSTAMAVVSDRVEPGRAQAVHSDEHLHMVWKDARLLAAETNVLRQCLK